MKNVDLFHAMQELYESFSSSGALPNTMTELGCLVQTGGKGDPTYIQTVVCCFKSAAGDSWNDFCVIYTGKPLTPRLERVCKSELQKFWREIKKNRSEYESVARKV